MRKFCWLYRDKLTSKIYRVQKPTARAFQPVYLLMWPGGNLVSVTEAELKKDFDYVGKLEE